ncbi:hypothetical protein [Collimonas arenae]|uniref:hypothetical protein n=1 Tax=Collimonas arenae TaxID=279058 RepID=UPI00056E7630|nr:hypothetical protein [Collimonas arenae]
MNEIMCPHCGETILFGENVCIGCKAEIEYGAPRTAYLALVTASILFGILVSQIPLFDFSLLAWFFGMTTFVVGSMCLERFFIERVIFKRP